ncbi:hypothetical protein SAMN04487910_2675 [Aquimarina amphilecti]|uniref:Uncharacterized protein n=1 Tax=Aquimarina amphilecti TaxID=1038014 RepID=A0A1H7QUT1_AQUAM|nr:hypothetical protein SAMN04487910_2675 [Aquimarina amphilecti]
MKSIYIEESYLVNYKAIMIYLTKSEYIVKYTFVNSQKNVQYRVKGKN